MSYATKNLKNVMASIFGLVVVAAIGVWQFYAYVTFKDASGVADGGGMHLLLSIVMAVFACAIGFLVFSVFLRHDTDDDLHITFAPTPGQQATKAKLR